MSSSAIISTPATPYTTPTPQFALGMPVAFIYNRTIAVPATITSVNPDGETYDISALIPQAKVKVKFKSNNQDFKRKSTMELVEQTFKNVRIGEPRIIYVKVGIPLDQPQVDETRGIRQTHIDRFQDSQKRLRSPKFHEFHTNIIGNIFNPEIYLFRVWAWRAEMEVEKGVIIPEENTIWPNTQGYLPYMKAFNRFFKESYQKVGKWNRVEMQTFLKEDVEQGIAKINVTEEENQP